MTKKITIWSTKGGVGKTSICAELHFRLGYPVVTNEQYTMLTFVVEKRLLKILENNDKIQNNYNHSILFDFGGYIDFRLIEALKQSDFLIIPCSCDVADIQGCFDAIKCASEYISLKKIIVIINKVKDKKEYSDAKDIFAKKNIDLIFPINETKALKKIYINKCSIEDSMKKNHLLKFAYKKINQQILDIIDYINL